MTAKVVDGQIVIPAKILWGMITLLTMGLGTGTWGLLAHPQHKHQEKIAAELKPIVAVNTARIDETKKSLQEIKQGQRDTNAKLDRLIEIQLRNRSTGTGR